MKKIVIATFIITTLFSGKLSAQNVGINSTGATPNASAGLDIDFTDKGVLIPRVALTQTTSNAPIGVSITTALLVYNTATVNDVTPGFYYWNGTIWVKVQAGNTVDWNLLGNTGINQPAVPGTYGTSTIGSTENFLGTTDNRDVVIGTNNIERLRVKQTTGNVGIGTAAPANTLQVIGNASIGSTTNNVTGTNSVAAGSGNTISDAYSFIAGGQGNTITGQNNLVSGYLSRAQAGHSIVVGYTDTTTASATAVFGFGNRVNGFTGFAAGDRNKVNASNAFATGYLNNANGDGSIVAGQNNTAASYGEAVFGLNSTNYTALGTGSTFNAADRIFNIGNGTNTGARADAFTILKNGRVGINNASPNGTAKLDITATDKGMLVPRVALTATNSASPITRADGAAAATSDLASSLLVYNTATAGVAPNNVTPGFYYWNGTVWVKIALTSDIVQDHDWYETGTTTAPDNINDNMFHTGNVSIGTDAPTRPLVVFTDNQDTAVVITQKSNLGTAKTGVRVNMLDAGAGNSNAFVANISGTNTGNKTVLSGLIDNNSAGQAIGANVSFSGTGTGQETGYVYQSTSTNPLNKIAFRNYISSGSAPNVMYGLLNEYLINSNSPNMFGVYNSLNGRGNKVGMYSESTSADSSDYRGVYNRFISAGMGTRFGVQTSLEGTGNSINYGSYNHVLNSGSGYHYGTFNFLSGTGTAQKYASYDTIPVGAGGSGFGVFSSALDTANDYAGFFRGKLSVGMNYTNNYIFPTTRGTINQILTADANGITRWANARSAIDTVAWLTTGNSGTDTSTNFLGTLDDMPLQFKVNNIKAGLLDHGRGNNFIGKLAGTSNTTGQRNNAMGTYALYTNLAANDMVAIGDSAASIYNGAAGNIIAIGSGAMSRPEIGLH